MPRGRLIRDPVHGDIFLGSLQASIVDTPVFQRLRYIKQNGLLHFVFPGAVHTRFGHSLGTMHTAGRVFSSLFPAYLPARPEGTPDACLLYLGQVFQTAALLHDVGHAAFSHSIEKIDVNSESFLLPLREYAREWDDSEQLVRWLDARADKLDLTGRPTHEGIGLLLIGLIFQSYGRVAEATRALLNIDPIVLADDARALIEPALDVSPHFEECAVAVTRTISGIAHIAEQNRPEQLKIALSTLISGTLDVDRMDYLIRDSHYTGTVYGLCDTDVIISSLQLCVGESGGPTLHIGLQKRATQAVDDFIWSRYQLFTQVLNHKTNVILNAMLAEALPEAVKFSSVGIGQPRTLEEFLEFTDYYVMSSVISASLRDSGRSRRMYYRALVARDLPLYLGRIDVTGYTAEEETARTNTEIAKLSELVATKGFNPRTLRHWRAESALIKGGGLPFVLEHDKVRSENQIHSPSDPGAYQLAQWANEGRLPTKIVHVHFFVDRER
jgi:HD superfamily phosphohydrolase